MRRGGRFWGATRVWSRGCSKCGDEVRDGGGVVHMNDGGESEDVDNGCSLAELTVLGSGGCMGGKGGKTSAGGWLRGATPMWLRGCSNDGNGA